MTGELYWLTLTALLAGGLWIPFVIGINTAPAGSAGDTQALDFSRPADPGLQRPWVHRAYRAHLNLLEQFLPFAVLVIVLHLAGISTALTLWTCAIFFWLRVSHAVWMIAGLPVLPMRPIIFTTGWICILVLAGAAILG